MSEDYYKTLGVSKGASPDEIRKAFKKIAKESHPDVKPGDAAAAERFKAAAEAYDVLGDTEKRKKYDQFGANWKHVGEGSPFGGGQSPFRNGGPVDVDLRDIFGQGGADLESIFGNMFGGGGRRPQPQPQRGADLKTAIRIPLLLSATGGPHELYVNSQRITVQIPAGIEDGKSIRLAGEGEPGQRGGPAGDLLITVYVDPHPYFRREADNVLLELPITMSEAGLGAKVDVPTMTEGEVTLTIPPGTSSGAKLRLKGKGFQSLKTKKQGDQLVIIKIVAPKSTDPEVQRILIELAEHDPTEPRQHLW